MFPLPKDEWERAMDSFLETTTTSMTQQHAGVFLSREDTLASLGFVPSRSELKPESQSKSQASVERKRSRQQSDSPVYSIGQETSAVTTDNSDNDKYVTPISVSIPESDSKVDEEEDAGDEVDGTYDGHPQAFTAKHSDKADEAKTAWKDHDIDRNMVLVRSLKKAPSVESKLEHR